MLLRSSKLLWLLCLAGVSCGGGGGGGGSPADLTGVWKVFITPTGGVETGPTAIKITQIGSQLDGAGVFGSVSGSSFTVTSVSASFTTAFIGTVLGGNATGTFTVTGSINASGTFRLERFTPTGSFTANGTLQTMPIAISETTAVGARDYDDPALTGIGFGKRGAASQGETLLGGRRNSGPP